MTERKPFTYLIYCKPTDQYYYGVRYGKGCDPSQLWNTYFTSCKKIKQLIKQYGKESFIVKIRKVFSTPKEARLWETRFLKRVNAVNY